MSKKKTDGEPKIVRILVVDDDPNIVKFLTMVLESAAYQVVSAISGEAAAELLLDIQPDPDLALLDINMPGMSGLELAKHLRAETAVPFMFLSSLSDQEIIKTATEHGALGYLLKPVEASQVLSAVQVSLARAKEFKSLTTALEAGRETSMAVGILMERFQINRQPAFEKLRSEARRNRMKLTHIANLTLLTVESQTLVKQDK